MINKYILAFIFILTITFSYSVSNSQNIYKKIAVSKCDSLIKANTDNPNFVILDVRTHGEWVGDHLEGSINRSTRDSDFDQQLDALPKHKIFLMHCQSGGRSASAFTKMKNLGFSEVYEMQGGMSAWKSSSLPTTSLHAPKLMLVAYTDSLKYLYGADTINVTITNRENDLLTFSSATISDFHEITNNFNTEKTLSGAEDYTFSIYHDPAYSDDDSTTIFIESNGGELEVNIVFKNGVIQNIESEFNENILVLYPNPARNNLYLKSNSIFDIKEISLINLGGQIVLIETEISASNGIDISGLPNGIYVARIATTTKTFSKKIVIKQ